MIGIIFPKKLSNQLMYRLLNLNLIYTVKRDNGLNAMDKDNYKDHTPCVYIEGDATSSTLNVQNRDITSQLVKSRLFSSEITIQIKPNSQWGSCHTELDEGLVNIVNYQNKLDYTKGLYLQMYRGNAIEKYRIEYIAVNVELE